MELPTPILAYLACVSLLIPLLKLFTGDAKKTQANTFLK